jgi:AcrR family transcriptional regulator
MLEKRSTKERIVGSGLELFSRYGFRRTSVDEIAHQAGVAKGTVYLSFKSKDEIFRAVCEQVIGQLMFRAGAALAATGSLEERVLALLESRFVYLHEHTVSSAHGREILEPPDPPAAELFERAETRYRALLTGVLEAAEKKGEISPGRVGLTAAGAADLLMNGARGCGGSGTFTAAYRKRLAEMTRVLVAGLGVGR